MNMSVSFGVRLFSRFSKSAQNTIISQYLLYRSNRSTYHFQAFPGDTLFYYKIFYFIWCVERRVLSKMGTWNVPNRSGDNIMGIKLVGR